MNAVPVPSDTEIAAAPAPRRLLVGLIGDGIGQSLSPSLHEEEAACLGLRLHYQLIDLASDLAGDPNGLASLPLLLEAARKMGFAGLNITHPYKQAVIALLDDLSADARAIGAVNTVVIRDGRLTGHNTDWTGFAAGFEQALPDVPLRQVVLQGAGGAGAAAAHAILRMGAQALHVTDSQLARAQELAASLAARFIGRAITAGDDASAALATADGLIHATPTGMAKYPGLSIDPSALRSRPWVAEIVYVPFDTALLQAARAQGCRTATGGGMVVGQAAGAFELFTGIKPDAVRMQAHFRRLIGERSDNENPQQSVHQSPHQSAHDSAQANPASGQKAARA